MDALVNRLIQFCKGDKAKVIQLINEAKQNHPEQSHLWHLQKVMADLETEQAEQFRQKRIAPSNVSTPGKALRQTLAQSRRDNPGQSESWHLQNAQKQSKPSQNLVDAKQMKYLLNLLRGDRAAANRLVENTRKRNPGKSDQWVLEKVIYDLERDRHC